MNEKLEKNVLSDEDLESVLGGYSFYGYVNDKNEKLTLRYADICVIFGERYCCYKIADGVIWFLKYYDEVKYTDCKYSCNCVNGDKYFKIVSHDTSGILAYNGYYEEDFNKSVY